MQRWYQSDDGGQNWVAYVQDVKLMGRGWYLRKCVDKLMATCEAIEAEHTVVYNVEVDYLCQ
jgi:hypothetical protein